jgi:hypothetical protein
MADKKPKDKKKRISKSKQETKDRKKIEKVYGDGMRNTRGQKKEINKKRHKGKHSKGTKKGNG